MAQKVYVGNLPFSITEDELREYFSKYGEIVSLTLVKDRETGKSRGFGFVGFENSERALSEANGSTLGERQLTVTPAREREKPEHLRGKKTYRR